MPRSALTWFLASALLGLLLLGGCATVQERKTVAVKQHMGMTVTLFDEACADPKVAKQIQPEFLPKMRAGTVVENGKTYSLCWGQKDGEIFVIDELGFFGFLVEPKRPKGLTPA